MYKRQGGIPVVKAIRENLKFNEITKVYGILNGTCNYILTKMETEGKDFNSVLKDAQNLGFAELDPSFDIKGIDAAHKITLLSSLAFNVPVNFSSTYIEGIQNIEIEIEMPSTFTIYVYKYFISPYYSILTPFE